MVLQTTYSGGNELFWQQSIVLKQTFISKADQTRKSYKIQIKRQTEALWNYNANQKQNIKN